MHTFTEVANGDVRLRVALAGDGPLILCVHGWPELWYSWRHQLEHFAAAGYRVAAMDVRGYGGSSRPEAIAAYTLRELCGDVAAVIEALSDQPAILFGHDWGAPIVYTTALLHADRVRAVAGLSVPFRPAGERSFLDIARELYPDRFFYQLYFQKEGAVEAEMAADWAGGLRRIYYAASGDAPADAFLIDKPADAGLLDGLVDPQPFPHWMSAADLDVFVRAFRAGGHNRWIWRRWPSCAAASWHSRPRSSAVSVIRCATSSRVWTATPISSRVTRICAA